MLDINMPEMDGFEVCRRFKASAARLSGMINELLDVNRLESGEAPGGGSRFYFTLPTNAPAPKHRLAESV